ncbi:MAG: methyltransferase [Treponema sp.]|nr:methyltransferase [Treponema sp.]
MKVWYASVNYGLELATSKILKTHGAKNIKTLDSALIFSCQHEINVKCINNLFIILSSYFSENILDAAKRIPGERFSFPQLKGKTFRIIVMDCGKLRSIPFNTMNDMEKNVSQQTRLSVNRANPDVEIWLNRRNDNSVYFMLRVRKHRSFDKTLKKGELRPDVVEVMIHEAKISKDSVVADLFGGWGAIAAAVVESGRYKKVYTGDINDECVKHQKKRLHDKRNCLVQKWDARKLPLDDKSVDAIVTDPPWGEYETMDTPQFYNEFIGEAARVLRHSGSFVFLTSTQNEACQSLDRHGFSCSHTPLKIGGKDTFLFCAKHVKQKS